MVYQTPAKIVKGECRDKRKPCFRFDYAEPHPIFFSTNIRKGNHSKKELAHFFAKPYLIFDRAKDT